MVVAGLVPDTEAFHPATRRALFILVLAAGLWMTEAMPAYSVGILVIALTILLLGGEEVALFAVTTADWTQFVTVLGHPLIWLFFGGFVLAAGMQRTRLDLRLAAWLLRRVGTRPPMVLAGVMGVTAVLSMFMSNTATTAMMLALIGPVLASMAAGDRGVKGMLLGVAAAANVGGMGSLIGTPPNAIAAGALANAPEGRAIDFFGWMLLGLPPALVLLVMAWGFILWRYPSSAERLDVDMDHVGPRIVPAWERVVVGLTVVVTVGLWLTSSWHGLPTTVVSFVPIVVFTTTGILGVEEIRGLPYDVLFLIAGGLLLGEVVVRTGLSTWIVGHLPVGGMGIIGVAIVMSYVTVVLSNVMSNTAAANILVPLAITMAAGHAAGGVAVPVALSASAAMCLPVATPPNALVHGTGRVRSSDFVWLGVAVGTVAPVLAVGWVRLVGGLLP